MIQASQVLYLPEYFLNLDEDRQLTDEDRELRDRHFDRTEDGFYKPNQRLMSLIVLITELGDLNADLQGYNYEEFRSEQEQDQDKPNKSLNIAHERLHHFKDGALEITTADQRKWKFREMRNLLERREYFNEKGVDLVHIYLIK